MVVPAYEDQIVGKTDVEIKNQFNKSNYFLTPRFDYRGNNHTTEEDLR
jgi:hypothetical protein